MAMPEGGASEPNWRRQSLRTCARANAFFSSGRLRLMKNAKVFS